MVRLLRIGERRGFPGMLGSIDCMHWQWKNFPLRLKGSRNDINVLDRSPLFNDVFEGCAPSINYVVNEHQYNMGYYLSDGIYPKWAAFIPTISLPQNEKEGKIIIACIIMHNMIVEDERDTYKTYYDLNEYDQTTNASSSNRNTEESFQFENSNNRIASLEMYMSNRARVRDETMHKALKKDLVEHMWLKFGVKP
ncbi:uncharacterized protein LOC110729190 [Chenopodium quinoa]|uniref:uncharacterized protein LOC110729190 n=1 Tax=Chenopodium quinoa TaxID=63459 RepID=UPI000B780DCF|nr:uncharacterized protein LOC110729190 [Chenopodium quinoa]